MNATIQAAIAVLEQERDRITSAIDERGRAACRVCRQKRSTR
jgi:hypothetical protein